MRKTVRTYGIEDVAKRIAELDEENERLAAKKDAADRPLMRLKEELAAMTSACRSAVRATERFKVVADRMDAAAALRKERSAEAELDESFTFDHEKRA